MAKVSNREDALLNAYLSRYKNAQASTVNEGQNKTQTARAKGAALLNATDKTLPVLKDTYSDTLHNVLQGASLENSLNNDVLNRQMNLAQAKFKQANDLYEQQKKAQQYAEKQAEKEAAAAAKAAAKAARSGRSSGKGSGKSGSSTDSASGEDAGAAMDALFGSAASTGGSTAGSTASSKPKAEDTKKDETKSEKPKEKSAQEKYLEAKKAGTRTTAAKSYAEQNGTGRVSAAQPAQSRAVTKGGKVIASSYAAAGSSPSAAETQAATQRKQQTADALKKLQTDSSYRAELAAPGRKLTAAEVQAVNQYNQNANDLLKQVNNGTLSWDDYNTQAQALSKLNQKATMGGWGQDLQAFTAGLMRSFPLQKQTEKAFTDWADKQTGGKYTHAVESGALPAVVPTLDKYTEQDQLAAMAGSMAGKMAQYKYFNQLMAGTPYAAVSEKAGGKLYDAAKKIPVLQNIVQPGFGEAAGRVLADTGADLALDILPTLADDLSTYSAQQQATANGQTVDDALTPGKIAGNTAKNIAGNVAMNALPEIGGAVMNDLKNGRTARNMLDAQANGIENGLNAEEANALVDAYRNADNGKAGTMLTADDLNIGLQNLDVPEDAIDFTTAMQNELDAAAQTQRNAAQTTRARQLNAALAEQAAQDQAEYAAKQAAQNSVNLPIDVQGQAGYNGAKVGAVNENLGGNVSADIRNVTERGEGTALQPRNLGNGLSGQAGEGGQGGAAGVLGERVQGHDVQNPVSMADEAKAAVGEWAESITGKDRRSPYTRRIESLYSQMQNGASLESLAEEAKSIALGVVRAEDYAEPLDETVTVLKDYLKTTPIKIDAQTQGELLNASGLKTLSQYNIQNGTHFTLKDGVDYDTAVTEVYDMMGMGNRIPDGNAADALMQLVDKSKTKPLIDTDAQGAYTDYIRDRILDGPNSIPLGGKDYEDWLEVQSFDKDAPDYIKRILERDFSDIPQPQDYNLLSLDDNYQRFSNTPYYDDNELDGVFLNDTAPLASDTAYSYAADHLQDATARQSGGSVDTDSPYYNEWMLNQGALRQQQAAAELLNDNADAMETAANRIDSLNRRNEELLEQDAQYRQQQAKATARQAQLDAIQQEYDQAVNNVPALDYLAGDAGDWQSQPGLMLENGDVLDAYTATTARQTAGAASGQNTARPLNGSESVPENAVGATNARYSTDKIVENKDYANQAATRAVLDDAHREGLTYSKHQVWTDTEAQHQALDDINTYIQEAGGDVDKGLDNAMNSLRKDTQWDKGESVTANNIRDRLRTEYMNTEPGTPEFYRQKARYDDWQSEISKQRSKVAQTMQSFTGDATARMHEVSNPIREKWETQHSVEAARIKQLSDELDKLKTAVAQRNLDDMNSQDFTKGYVSGADRFPVQDNVKFPQNIRESIQKAGDMDAEFGQMLKDNGIPSHEERVSNFSAADKEKYKIATEEAYNSIVARVKKLCEKNKVNIDDDGVKTIAGKIMNGDNAESYYNSLIMQAAGISDLTIDEMEKVDNLYSQAAKLPDGKARYDLEQQAIGIMAKHLPAKSWFERFDNIRYLAMLGNPTTHARNLIGNVLMKGLSDTKDEVAAAMQLVTTKKADRTKALYVPQDMKNAASKWIDENHYTDVLKDGGKYNLDSGLERARSTYGNSKAGRFVQGISDFNSDLLDKEDEIFVKLGATHSLANILTARGYDASIFTKTDEASQQALREALELAKQDAKDVTFHADTALTKAMNRISKAGDKNGTLGDKIAYCIGNGILPFAKTPANILKTAAEYNPVGATVEAMYRGATHKGSAAVTDALAKGVVGSGIMGVGYWLAHEGFLTGTLDEDTKDYDEMLGKQEYSVNIPGVGSYSIDWAAPAIVPLMMGANLEQSGYDLDTLMANPDNFAKMFGQASDILVNALDPVTDMSMMQSLNNTLDNIRYNDESIGGSIGGLALDAGTSYLKQYMPTIASKAARTIDDTRRSSYGGGSSATERNTNYLLRSTLNKVPVLSKNNEPYIDQWGREEASLDGTDDSAGGMFLRGAYNFGSPGYYSAENVTPVDEYLQGLYGSTNDSHVLPEKASSQIKVDGEGYYMIPKEKTEYAKTSGQTAYDIVDSLRQNDMFLQLPEDQQSALVQDAYSVAKTAGGVAAVGDGVSGVGAKEYEAYRDGGAEGFSQYVLMKNATDLVRDEKRETSGNDNADLNTVEKWNTLYSQFGEDAVSNFVNSTDKGSTVHNISDLAGDKAVTAYMQSYSAVAKTLDDGQTPDKFTVGYGMQKYGLSGDDFARAYLAAYYKKDKNGKYPEKGGSYADKAGAEIYQSYGADALQDWVNYRATIPDTNGNGKVDKDEAVARLNEMDLTNELRRAYLTKTNKQWKNPY